MTLPSIPIQYFDRQGRLQNLGPTPQSYSVPDALSWITTEYVRLTTLVLQGTEPVKLIEQFDALTAAAQRGQIACRMAYNREQQPSVAAHPRPRVRHTLTSLESLL